MKLYSEFSDQELLHFLRSGDSAAYTEIYHRYKFILHQHAWNKEEAQDIFAGGVYEPLVEARDASN